MVFLNLSCDSSKTHVVNIRHTRAYDVYIGRPSEWANPFRVGIDGNRRQVCEMYLDYLLERPELIERGRVALKGKVLGCWCAPLTCHGHIWCNILR